MGLGRFVKELFGGRVEPRIPHEGDELAEDIRDAMGPQAGGGRGGGRMTGSAVYKLFENRKR